MKNVIKRLIEAASSAGPSAKHLKSLLRGGIDLVTPSMINGWAWHPEYKLSDVRLLAGSSLLAAAAVDVHRSDVEEKVGAKGNYGFSLKLPVSLPSVDLDQSLQLVVVTADGSTRFPLACMKDKGATLTLLRTALDPKYFGMEGNFDGFANDGMVVTGWCFQSLLPANACTVFIQVEGMNPVAVRCDQYRPGFSALGYPESCGFMFHLADLRSLSGFGGRRLAVTFDQSGLLPLPEASPCFLPSLSSTGELATSDISKDVSSAEHGYESLEIHSPAIHADMPDLAKCRRDLEEFKRGCDVFEREIAARIQQESLSSKGKGRRLSGWRRLFSGKS